MQILKNLTLLYAEDETITQALYVRYFKDYFKTVLTAENGQQALDLYNSEKPDVVILDINMPILSGLEVSKRIRESDKETKVILFTARTDKEALLKAVELGLITYLEKPVSKEKLQQALKKISAEFKKAEPLMLWHIDGQNYSWDYVKRELSFDNKVLSLTKKEILLFELLLTTRQDKISNQIIYENVWEDDEKEYSENAIKAVIKGLRAKLPPETIKNIYGLGYYLNIQDGV